MIASETHDQPERDIYVYTRMIEWAIRERYIHEDMYTGFRLCLPKRYVELLRIRFYPDYRCLELGTNPNNEKEVYTLWTQRLTRKNR